MWILEVWGRGPYRVDLSSQVSHTARQRLLSFDTHQVTYSLEDILFKSALLTSREDWLTLNFLFFKLKA
jgi:hypothetical protein